MIKRKSIKVALSAVLFISQITFAQKSKLTLQAKIGHIIDTAGGKIGIGVQGLDFNDGFIINGNHQYPMMSVFKFPLALAILHRVDIGELKLSQKFFIPKEKLDTKTWSPMLEEFPNQDINMTLANLLTYAVSKSDNNACDFLYNQVAKGTKNVNSYLHANGIKDISIVYTEGEMEKGWDLQYKNWCKPYASLQLLQLLYNQKLLSKTSNDFLINIMRELPSWGNRITLLLPPKTELIHKTGSSGVNKQGIMAAFNDIGIVTLPNGKHLAIAIFMSDFKAPKDRGINVIAAISRQIWDYYSVTN